MITLYGIAPSRTYRCLWLLEEMGLEYERERVRWDDAGEARAAYLELNPNGRVPCLVDGDLVLFESLAINLYLVRRYGGAFAPASIEEEGLILQWSFWATNEFDPLLTVLTTERAYGKPEEEWDKEALAAADAALVQPSRVLEEKLAGRDYLLGGDFSLADLNVAAVLYPGPLNGYEIAQYPNVSAWFERCTGREASQRVAEWAFQELAPPP
jgi:glutathione S-transferase